VFGVKFVIPFWLFVALWVVTLLLPIIVWHWSAILAVALGLLLPIAWVSVMPATCMGGAFIAFPMALIQLGSLAAWISPLIRLCRH
jgi:hypothetical protein